MINWHLWAGLYFVGLNFRGCPYFLCNIEDWLEGVHEF